MVGGTDAHQYAVIGAVLGVVAAVMTLACGLMTKERLKPKRAEKFSFHQFVDLVHNKAWLYMTAIAVCTNFFNGFRYAVAGYMFDYCLHGNVTVEGLIINYTVFMAFGEVTCMILVECLLGLLAWLVLSVWLFLGCSTLFGTFHCFLLYPNGSILYLGYDSFGCTHFYRYWYLFTIDVVYVC